MGAMKDQEIKLQETVDHVLYVIEKYGYSTSREIAHAINYEVAGLSVSDAIELALAVGAEIAISGSWESVESVGESYGAGVM